MVNGRYVYCILEGEKEQKLGNIGLFDTLAYTITYKGIGAVVSSIPFKEMQPDVENIAAHQRVVETSRNLSTTLPVRFGIMFKTEEGVKKLLIKSHKDFKSKITKFRSKDEFGLKIVIDKTDMKKIAHLVENSSDEIMKIKKEISMSGDGTSYFLKMRMDEAIKNGMFRKIDQLGSGIHRELVKSTQDSCLLKADLEQIILNAAYLVDRNGYDSFNSAIERLRTRYEGDGLTFHVSGPWAPYSFC